MALRVLLADESVTIKKVFQLALQDFAVEVTSVTVGLDVLTVAEKVKPDIVFADVLLQKKSGYDVSREIKSHPALARTPVVLMWSGFMELDQARYKTSGAEAHLEKPFDTQRLRQVVQTLVPKTKTQPLSSYLTFPKLPDFEEGPRKPLAGPYPQPPPADLKPMELGAGTPEPEFMPPEVEVPSPTPTGNWNMDSFAPIEPLDVPESLSPLSAEDEVADEFMPVKLPQDTPAAKGRAAAPIVPDLPAEADEAEDAQWLQKTLSQYKLPPQQQVEADRSVKIPPQREAAPPVPEITRSAIFSQTSTSIKPAPPKVYEAEDASPLELDLDEETQPPSPVAPQLNERQLEAIIRAQSQDVIEKVVWQVVPEIATRIIERELERLLKERKFK